MSPREIVDAYLEGRINSWGVYRRLIHLGLTTATALAVAGALPGAVKSLELGTLTAAAQSATETALLDELATHLASQLQKVAGGGPIRPLATTLARIGANNRNLLNCVDEKCNPIPININSGDVNLTGNLSPVFPNQNVETTRVAPGKGNLSLSLNGQMLGNDVELVGTIDPPNAPGLNLGQTNLNFTGHVGEVKFDLNGSLAHLSKTGRD